MIWHHVTAQQALEQLQADEHNGLTQAQLWQRQQELRGEHRLPPFFAYTAQRHNLARLRILSWVLAAAICAVLIVLEILHIRARQAYSFIPALIVLVAVGVNAAAWALLRRRLRQTGRRLVQQTLLTARVLRQGETVTCRADELVPGDILLLQVGDQISADARLIEAQGLLCLQKAITGESEPAAKDAGAVLENITPLAARCNMVYAGTAVLQGTARAVVTEVGKQTQLASLPAAGAHPTEEEKKWCAVMHLPMLLSIAGAVTVLLLGRLFCGQWLMPLLLAALFAAGCAGIDWETLYHAVYLRAALNLHKKGIMVRSEQTLDAAADISVLMADKTGTLTGARMALACFVVGDRRFDFGDAEPQSVQFLLRLATLCCSGSVGLVQGEDSLHADPTEAAILTAAVRRKMYPDMLQAEYPRLQCLPFTAQRQKMSSLHIIEGRYVLIVKGAPEAVLAGCIGEEQTAQKQQQLYAEGLRTVAVAYRFLDQLPAELTADDERGLTLLGLLGLRDIPQEKVMDTVERCVGADIVPVIFTGDHPQTAYHMARRLGLVQSEQQMLTPDTMPSLQRPDQVRVCARLDRQQRLHLLQSLQQGGKKVAVCGGEIEDVPLAEQADLSFACTHSAAQPLCAAADVLLQSGELSALARVVRTGRGAYRRLWQSSLFALAALAAAWLVNLFACLLHGAAAVQLWQWCCILFAEVPLLTAWLALRGRYGWQPKKRAVRTVLLTALIPLGAALIAAIFAWQAAAFAAGLAVQALLLSRQN